MYRPLVQAELVQNSIEKFAAELKVQIELWKKEEAAPSASDNSHCTPCQHAFYSIKFANKVRCNKCGAEFPLISTC